MALSQGPDQRWSLDFVSDVLANGRRFRVLVVVDDFTRECLALIVDTSISGRRVARELDTIIAVCKKPRARGRAVECSSDQGITKSGNPRARRTAIELAWLWLRHQPGSILTQWFHQRVGTTRGRMRRIILVALARKLIVALWRYLRDGLVPHGAELKA
jgi:transposase InsO family protein